MSTFCLNIENQALTRFTHPVFLRQWRIGSKNYGISSTGIFLIDGEMDDSEPFSCLIKTAQNSLGAESYVRVPEIRTVKRGSVESLLIYDGEAVSEGVESNSDANFIRFGKGGHAKYAAVLMVSNQSDFKLEGIKFMPQSVGLGAL